MKAHVAQYLVSCIPEHSGDDIFVYRALAFDKDEGRNALISYTLRGAKKSTFRVDQKSGEIYSTTDLKSDEYYELMVSTLKVPFIFLWLLAYMCY